MTSILEHFWTSLDRLDHRTPKACSSSKAGALKRVRPSSGTRPCRTSIAHHRQHAKQIDRIRTRARARGAGGLVRLWVAEPRAGRSATNASRISGIAPPTPLAGGGAPRAQWLDTTTGEPAPAPLSAALRPRTPRKKDKYLSARQMVASAMRAENPRIWNFKIPTFVLYPVARQ